MQSVSKILAPVDFSERCLGMMPYVKAFSQRYSAEVVLLHVVDPVYVIPDTGIAPPAILPMPHWLFDERAAELENFASADLAGLPVRRLIYEGDPESQIAATAQAERVELLIMATHGRGVFRRFLIGSVTAKVLHDVNCAVLTSTHAQEHAHTNPMNISNIVCSIGLTPQSQKVLAFAVSVAEIFEAKLRFVHVVPRSDPKLREALSSDLSNQVKEMVKTEIVGMRPVRAMQDPEISIEEGEVTDGVCRLAKASGADLVVTGRGSHTAQTDAVIRHSPCPVLSI
jgi:nucleotide-binding universal stress UspA family protein